MDSKSIRVAVPMRSAPMNSAPVIICDDHIAIRCGLTKMLEEQDIAVAGGCDKVSDLVDLVRQYSNAIVITDLAVDDVPFPILVTKLREQSVDCRVVVYSMREAPATVAMCYDAGAIAYVPKRAELEDIVKAVEFANRGERYIPALIAAELANWHIDRDTPMNILSEREMAIFIAFAREGALDKMAEELGLSEKTIQNSLSQIARKLGVSRASFYELARRHGLLDFQ